MNAIHQYPMRITANINVRDMFHELKTSKTTVQQIQHDTQLQARIIGAIFYQLCTYKDMPKHTPIAELVPPHHHRHDAVHAYNVEHVYDALSIAKTLMSQYEHHVMDAIRNIYTNYNECENYIARIIAVTHAYFVKIDYMNLPKDMPKKERKLLHDLSDVVLYWTEFMQIYAGHTHADIMHRIQQWHIYAREYARFMSDDIKRKPALLQLQETLYAMPTDNAPLDIRPYQLFITKQKDVKDLYMHMTKHIRPEYADMRHGYHLLLKTAFTEHNNITIYKQRDKEHIHNELMKAVLQYTKHGDTTVYKELEDGHFDTARTYINANPYQQIMAHACITPIHLQMAFPHYILLQEKQQELKQFIQLAYLAALRMHDTDTYRTICLRIYEVNPNILYYYQKMEYDYPIFKDLYWDTLQFTEDNGILTHIHIAEHEQTLAALFKEPQLAVEACKNQTLTTYLDMYVRIKKAEPTLPISTRYPIERWIQLLRDTYYSVDFDTDNRMRHEALDMLTPYMDALAM